MSGDGSAGLPRTAGLLSNGRYRVLLTGAGTGYSALGSCRLTAWRGDRVEDRDGFFAYLRDLESGTAWSLTPRPLITPGALDEVRWAPGRLAIRREAFGIESLLEACVDPGAPLEIRRVTLRNASGRPRRLDLTSHAEVVLNGAAAHAAHPAFSKLFVETELVPSRATLLARRRPRDPDERHPVLIHAFPGEGAPECETDRARFLGRPWGGAPPLALTARDPLSGTTGSVLDPVLSLRRALTLRPGETVVRFLLLGAAADREEALALLEPRADSEELARTFVSAEERERAILGRLGLDAREAERLQALAAALLEGEPRLRAEPAVLAGARGDPGSLRGLGVEPGEVLVVAEHRSGALPARASSWVAAHRYWRELGVESRLVILADEPASLAGLDGEGIRVVASATLEPGARDLLLASASLSAGVKTPAEVFEEAGRPSTAGAPPLGGVELAGPARGAPPETPPDEPLQCFNGYGGFSRDGGEYVIRLECREGSGSRRPPAPWINVVSNPGFGFLMSESGAGCTWSLNSREHRLTPWSNDPVLDPHGEALYIRDEEAGIFWSPLPGPAPHPGRYEMRHGFGYSHCRHESEELVQETWAFVPSRDPVKVVRLRLRNLGARRRRLSLFAFQRLVLGADPASAGRHVVTELDAPAGVLLARNRLSRDFGERVAFAAAVAPGASSTWWSGDREAFLGSPGDPSAPAALRRAAALDGRTGAGLDPCFAAQVAVEIGPGESLECAFLLGEGGSRREALALASRLRAPGAVEEAFREVTAAWRERLHAVRVETPSRPLDLVLNGWLLYQALSCRMWGRTALHQSGGAFGYRDQLQDAGAWVASAPDLTRSQLLLHAAHQFVEGDVLHWWHPPRDLGIRTRFADDLLWLPWMAAHYARSTGDWSVMEERAPFLGARALEPGEAEAYLEPKDSGTAADLYQHCCRAIDRGITAGPHGLPLFGSGDWNDGMNRVGREGRGESVWMAFFLHAVLEDFLPVCERRGDLARARRYRKTQEDLRLALERAAWDGEWYRRGYYDDGAPLGSAAADECRIDALAQAWAVLSGAAPPDRARRALEAVDRLLVSERDGLIRLLTPPFDRSTQDPGYIRGYLPGVRENGGQYTHAALWVVAAMARLGWNHRAAPLLEMLSPVCHARTEEQVAIYRVEPYVVAADVYGAAPHVGRGGWTWYTGSAAWMQRVALESVLGVRIVEGDTLVIRPCVPDDWPEFRVSMRLPGGETRYDILVRNLDGAARAVVSATADGAPVEIREGAARVPLARDGRLHRVEVRLGPAPEGEPGRAAEEAANGAALEPDPARAGGERAR